MFEIWLKNGYKTFEVRHGSKVNIVDVLSVISKFHDFCSLDKKSVNEKCSSTVLCNNDAGLSCQLGVCKCDSSSHFDGKQCGNKTANHDQSLKSF